MTNYGQHGSKHMGTVAHYKIDRKKERKKETKKQRNKERKKERK